MRDETHDGVKVRVCTQDPHRNTTAITQQSIMQRNEYNANAARLLTQQSINLRQDEAFNANPPRARHDVGIAGERGGDGLGVGGPVGQVMSPFFQNF